jgi:heptosyltransferase-2
MSEYLVTGGAGFFGSHMVDELLRQMMALLAASSLMITNDSGPMHVAAAFGVPMVAIFGPTDHTTTSTWRTRAQIVRHAVECSPCLLRQCPIDQTGNSR